MSERQDDVRAVGTRSFAATLSPGAVFALVVVAYLILHIALRLWETPIIAKNDVQEAVAAQAWAWGYHPRNPPLHTWLLMGSYALFGPSLIAHVALKYTLLGGVFSFAYLCARRLVSTPAVAVVAALSMSLLGPMAWTVHTALTHTLLMAVLILATLWAAMRVTDRGRVIDYAVFGLLLGLGLLAKYSFPLFVGPLLAAMLLQRDLRTSVVNARMLVAVMALAIVLTPHALWMLTVNFDFVAFLGQKQHSEAAAPYFASAAEGLGAILTGALTFLAPFVLVAPVIFWSQRKAEARPQSPWQRAVVLICVFGLALLLADVLLFKATQFELRYFTAALLLAPLAAFQWIDRREPTSDQLRAVCIAVAVVAFIGFAGLTGRAVFANRSCNRCWEEMPTEQLTHALRTTGFNGGIIVADHYNLAGNMRLAFPASRTIAANYDVALPAYEGEGACAFVWNARNAGDAVPAAITEYLSRAGLPAVYEQPRYVDALLRRSPDRVDRFGFVLVENARGRCLSAR